MRDDFTPTGAQARAADARTRYVAVSGGPGSGATSALALRAARLAGAGVPAGDILFAVACRAQVDPARRALRACMGDRAARVRVATVDELSTQVLATGGAPAPRRLAPFEVNALNEDVKTMGTEPKRLREMLKFFYRGLSELADRDPDWLITLEERSILERARAFGRETGSAVPCDLANRALAQLAGQAAGSLAFPHVLADGWTALDKASQALLEALASESLAVAGHAGDPGVAAHPYPHADGLRELAENHAAQTTWVDLGEAPLRAAAQEQSVWDLPADEFAGAARWLRAQLDAGRAPDELAAVVPNRVWARRLSEACAALEIPTRTLAGAAPLAGDARHLERCRGQRAFVLLELAADERDALAWRMQVGFGDPILASNRWEALRGWCAADGRGLADGLADLAETPAGYKAFPGADALAEEVRRTRRVLEGLAGRTGTDLLAGACSQTGADIGELAELTGPVGPDDDARSLAARLRAQLVDPAFCTGPGQGGAVRIGCADAFAGAHVAACALCGLVDGFVPGPSCFDADLPPDVRERNLTRERARFERARSVGTEQVLLSRFERDWLAEAEPARMEIARIRATQDPRGRMATIKPSAFLNARP